MFLLFFALFFGIVSVCLELAKLLIALSPIWFTVLIISIVIGIIWFLVIEYVIKKYVRVVLMKFIPGKVSLIDSIEKILNILSILVKIGIALLGFAMVLGFSFLHKEQLYRVNKVLLAAAFLPLLLFVVLRLCRKKAVWPLHLFFLIEPYIASLLLFFLGLDSLIEKL